MQIFWIILRQEFTLAGKNLGKVLQNFLFFFISLSVFFLISQNNISQGNSSESLINATLFCLIFSLIFSNSDFLHEDVIISQPNLEVYIFARMLGNWLIFSFPILLSLPLVSVIIGLNQNVAQDFTILTILASLTINFICAFCGSLGVAQNKSPMIAILAMPLVIPILLIACGNFSGGESSAEIFSSSLKILSGICIFVGSICVLATAKIMKIISE